MEVTNVYPLDIAQARQNELRREAARGRSPLHPARRRRLVWRRRPAA